MSFADLHNHSLWGVDDGAKTEQEMFAMVDAAYADGMEAICLTPHFHPGHFGIHNEGIEQAFDVLTRYAAEKYPDLRLYLGNELRCSGECLSWLESGICRTLNDSDHVLVDFYEGESERMIIRGLQRLMSAGYKPVLAHAERYRDLSLRTVWELNRNGIWIQIDVQSLFGVYGLGARMRSREMLKKKLVSIVATDAHGMGRRSPILSRGYRAVEQKYGSAYAEALFLKNPLKLLEGEVTNHE